jgi:hypothetical protein
MKNAASLGAMGLVLSFLGALLWQSFDTPAWTALDIDGPNYPTVVLVTAFTLFLLHTVRQLLMWGRTGKGRSNGAEISGTVALRMAAFIGLWIVYILVLPALGFTVASILAVSASILLQERFNPLLVILSSAVAILAMVVIFRRFLYVATPQGVVDRWIETTLYGLGI